MSSLNLREDSFFMDLVTCISRTGLYHLSMMVKCCFRDTVRYPYISERFDRSHFLGYNEIKENGYKNALGTYDIRRH